MSGKAYRLKDGEPPNDGIRRAAAGRAAKAADRLREDADENLAKAVHGARKDIKKVRSLLRLVRTSLGDETYHRENDRFRATAGRLGDARDAEAKLECLEKLRKRYQGEFPTRWSLDFLAMLEDERDKIASGPVPPEVAAVIEELEAGEQAVGSWDLDEHGFAIFAAGIRRAYKRGRNGLATAVNDPSGEAIHEWRKRVKDLWYQLRFLQGVWPEIIEPTSEQAHELSSILGDHHDLEVARQEIEGNPDLFHGHAQAQLLDLVDRRQRELVDEARPIGERLYAEKPKCFIARVAAYWETA